MTRYSLNGIPLDDANTIITTGSQWLAPISTVQEAISIPGQHGSVPTGLPPVYEPRSLTLKFGFAGERAWRETQRLQRLLCMPKLTLTRYEDGQLDRQVDVTLTSLSEDSTVPGRYASYTAVLAMQTVFWHGSQPEFAALGDDGLLLDVHGTHGLSTMWLGEPNNSVSVLATDGFADGYMSDAPITDMTIRVPSGVDSITLTDPVSGTSISWHGKTVSQPLYITPAALHAHTNSSQTGWDSGTDQSAGVDYGPNGPLQIWPDTTGRYRLTVQSHGIPSGQHPTIRYMQSWW